MEKDEVKIQIIDDEPNIILLLEHILKAAGYTNLTVAEDGEKAQDQARTNNFDIIITDVHMPKAGGLDVLFSTHDRENPPEVIVISGGGRDLSYFFEEAKMLGAAKTIKKPFNAKEVIDAVEDALVLRSEY